MRAYKEVAKAKLSSNNAKLSSNKTWVFLAAAKGYKEVKEWPHGRWGHVPNLWRIRIGLNLIHGPLSQNRMMQHCGWKGLCSKSTIAVDSELIWRWFLIPWKVDLISFPGSTWTNENGVRMKSWWPSQVVSVLQSESTLRDASFFLIQSIVPE
jgi:hypothetical protein